MRKAQQKKGGVSRWHTALNMKRQKWWREWKSRKPATSAGLTDRVWTTLAWISYPERPCMSTWDTTRFSGSCCHWCKHKAQCCGPTFECSHTACKLLFFVVLLSLVDNPPCVNMTCNAVISIISVWQKTPVSDNLISRILRCPQLCCQLSLWQGFLFSPIQKSCACRFLGTWSGFHWAQRKGA